MNRFLLTIDIEIIDAHEFPRWIGREVNISCDAREGYALKSLKYAFNAPELYLRGAEDDTCQPTQRLNL